MTDCYKCPWCQAFRPLDTTGDIQACAACGAWVGASSFGPYIDDGSRYDGGDLLVKALDTRAILPRRAHILDAGLDVYALEAVDIMPTDGVRSIPLGIAIAIPPGHEGQVRGRSGLTSRGLTVHLGTIDAGYSGEVSVLCEASRQVRVPYGRALAQLVIAPVTLCGVRLVDELPVRDARGDGGFGSTDGILGIKRPS